MGLTTATTFPFDMDTLHIVIDTREQQPWSFAGVAETSVGTVESGDYALAGDSGFAIERKSLDDFAGTISSGWDRFQNELDRMDEMMFPARIIIVEADWMEVIQHDYNHPDVKPPFVLKRVAELLYDGVSVVFCSNRTAAAGLCWRLLYERKQRLEKMEHENDT